MLGEPATEETFARAADAELAQARPLRDNAYKVPLARNLIVSVLAEIAREA
jgi:xanthine dehydrogenase YagS FAD-binding subunit